MRNFLGFADRLTRQAKLLLLCLSCLLFSLPAAQAALDLSEIGVGARPLGLGKAYTAVADDASALFTNPAGLALSNSLDIISMSGAMLGDVNYFLLGAADITPVGRFGFGYVNASVGSIPLTSLVGSGPSLEAVQYSSSDYGSSQFIFSYGSRLSRFLKNGAADNIGLGVSLKLFSQGFTGGAAPPTGGANPLNDASGSGMDADFGLLWQYNDWTSFGLVCQNFLPESFGGRFNWQKNAVSEPIPMIARLGGKFHLLGPAAYYKNNDRTLDVSLDYENNSSANYPAAWHLGLEFQPRAGFFLRGGLDQQAKAAEAGIGVDNNLSLGVGLLLAGFSFDYAYHQFGELSDNATHFFSLGYCGEEERRVRPRPALSDKKKPAVPLPEVVGKPAMAGFSDVPANYWAQKPIQYLATLGLMSGFPDGTFRPTAEVTRREMAVMLVKAKGFSVTKEIKNGFFDVPANDPAAPFISLAVERNYLTGHADGSFQPGQVLTRAEAAVIMAKFAGLYVKEKVQQKPFADVSVDHWAAPAIAADKGAGLFAYLAGQGFGPALPLTRAEVAEMISKTPFAKTQIEKLISGGDNKPH
ncbi:MAG: S-layer homology domain-containing protein [Candidatus Saganbacteria bacterium]|nr:S-layer homology domain-containing protein [Candidatus Saganbacteria bacterium]